MVLRTTYTLYLRKRPHNRLPIAAWRKGGGGGRYPFLPSGASYPSLASAEHELDELAGPHDWRLAFLYSSRPRSNMMALFSCLFSTRLAYMSRRVSLKAMESSVSIGGGIMFSSASASSSSSAIDLSAGSGFWLGPDFPLNKAVGPLTPQLVTLWGRLIESRVGV